MHPRQNLVYALVSYVIRQLSKASRKKFILAHPVYLLGIRIKLVHEDRRIKVKVTG